MIEQSQLHVDLSTMPRTPDGTFAPDVIDPDKLIPETSPESDDAFFDGDFDEGAPQGAQGQAVAAELAERNRRKPQPGRPSDLIGLSRPSAPSLPERAPVSTLAPPQQQSAATTGTRGLRRLLRNRHAGVVSGDDPHADFWSNRF